MATEFHTFGDRVIHKKYLELGRNAKATSLHFCAEAAAMQPSKKGPNRHMVKEASLRYVAGDSLAYLQRHKNLEYKGGRLPALDDIAIQNIKNEAEQAKRENHVLRPGREEAWARMKKERLAMVVRRGIETSLETFDHSKYDLTERTLHCDTMVPRPRGRGGLPPSESEE